jgi:hypothetical protein
LEKIPTLFLRNPERMQLVTREVNPEAAWVFAVEVVPTVKRDGTNVRVTILNGKCIALEKRRNPTREEKATGAEPGYVLASIDDSADKHIFAAVDATDFSAWPEGQWSAEALGPKIQGGVESSVPMLYPFSFRPIHLLDFPAVVTFESIRDYLEIHPIEGIVWHDPMLHRMAKIKRRDFGLEWPVKKGKP